MTNKTSGSECSCDWGLAGDAWFTNTYRGGWGASSLIRTSWHLWRAQWQTRKKLERHGDMAPAGRVTLAPWLLPWFCSARVCRLGRQARDITTVCMDQLSVGERTASGSSCGQVKAEGPQPEGGINLDTYSSHDSSCLLKRTKWPKQPNIKKWFL